MRPFLAALLLAAVLVSPASAMRRATTTERHKISRTWARFNSRNLIKRCQYGDGYVVLHRRHGKWRIVWQGSDLPACPARGVPYRVGADLRICRT